MGEEVNPQGDRKLFEYTPEGNPAAIWDENMQATYFEYSPFDQVVAGQYGGSTEVGEYYSNENLPQLIKSCSISGFTCTCEEWIPGSPECLAHIQVNLNNIEEGDDYSVSVTSSQITEIDQTYLNYPSFPPSFQQGGSGGTVDGYCSYDMEDDPICSIVSQGFLYNLDDEINVMDFPYTTNALMNVNGDSYDCGGAVTFC